MNKNMKIQIVDDVYKNELQAFFEDPKIEGCKKFGVLHRGSRINTLAFKKDKKGIHVTYDEYDIVDDVHYFLKKQIKVPLAKIDPDDFGIFDFTIRNIRKE